MTRLFFILFGISLSVHAQKLQLSSGNCTLKPIKVTSYRICKQDVFNGKAHLLMQMKSIPTQEEKEKMEKSGISFLQYMPQNAYIISVDEHFSFDKLQQVYTISSIKPLWKQHLTLVKKQYPVHALYKETNIQLIVSFYDDVNFTLAQQQLELNKIHILSTNKEYQQITIRIPIKSIEKVASYAFVRYLEPINPEPTPENYTGSTLIKTNHLYNDWSTGQSYNGNGINVMLQDDGVIGPHIDYQGRTIQYITTTTGVHGDHVGGTIMGGGNLNPLHRGMAWGATVHVYDANDNNYNIVPTIYNNNNIVITSKSYAQTCNGGYTAICSQLDKQLNDFPYLQHFFSAGNTGTNNCGYGAGPTWGNITGGHKSAKNTLAVGNTTYDGVIAPSSSRGPATDGRIKPDICAKGTDVTSTTTTATDPSQYITYTGTSMSCPMASGTMAVLYEAFQKNNGGKMPYNALMKAIMMNTADDYGNNGPDFKYGFGIVNAARALKVIKQKTYLIDSIQQGANKNYIVNVPSGTKRLKVMIYWNDKEAASGALPALVNDINGILTENGIAHQPLRLDASPNPLLLNKPAFEGNDSLNNVEQFVIENPPASCNLRVNGFAIPFGPQKFCIVYDFIEEGIRLTYPHGKEKLKPGESEVIRWESADTTNKISIRYSTDGGSSWTNIAVNLNSKFRSFNWTVPNIPTDKLMVRVEQDIFADSNEVTSTIMLVPTGLTLVKNCGDSLILTWAATPNTKGYVIYALGDKYMDSVAYVNTNRYVKLCNNPYDVTYYAVASIHNNDFTGRRCVAIPKNGLTGNCTATAPDLTVSRLISPALNFSRTCQGKVELQVTAKVANLANVLMDSFYVNYKIDTFSPVTVLRTNLAANDSSTVAFTLNILTMEPGIKHLKVWTNSSKDIINCNDSAFYELNISKEELKTLLREDFESFTPCSSASNCEGTVCPLIKGWVNETNGSGDQIDWRVFSGPTPSGFQGTGPKVDANPGTSTGNYIYLEASSCNTKTAHLISPCIDLNGMTNPSLSFKYHMYGTNINALHVDLYNGTTWILDIVPALIGNKGNQWNAQEADLSAYTGIINIRFRGLTGTGSLGDMALDDIAIYSKTNVKASFNTADPLCANKTIRFYNTSTNSNQHQWSFGADATPSTSIAQDYVDVVFAGPGEKTIQLIASNPLFKDTSIMKLNLEDIPKIDFTYNITGNDCSFTNNTLYAGTYAWNFGDGNTSTSTNPSNKYNKAGSYDVTLIATGNCGVDSLKKNINITNAGLGPLQAEPKLRIEPNPTKHAIQLHVTNWNKGHATYQIKNIEGKDIINELTYTGESISVQALPAGLYLIQWKQGNEIIQEKFIKE